MSVISRDQSPLFDCLAPRPAHYFHPARLYARRLYDLVKRSVRNGARRGRTISLLPEFDAGDTLAHKETT